MSTEVKLPELGEGIESGDVLEVLVNEGDVISEGQDIIEMETDKATVPVPATTGGKVVKIHVSPGDSVPVGGVLLEVEAAEGAREAQGTAETEVAQEAEGDVVTPEPQPSQAPAPAQPTEATAEQAAETAEPPAAEAPRAEEQPAAREQARRAAPPPAPAGAEPVEQPSPGALTHPTPSAAEPPETQPAAARADEEIVPAGPAIRRFAREVGVDLTQVRGSGEGGRITREDVLRVVRQTGQAARGGAAVAPPVEPAAPERRAETPTGPAAPVTGLPGTADADEHGPVRVERMSKVRKTIAHRMHVSWSSVPRVTNFDDADITDLERLRKSSKEDYAAQGIKLTTMPFLIKAVATALRHHPALNAVIDSENEQIIYKDYVNIGVAVDTERGLVVPVMKNVDRLGIPDVARGVAELAAKVRSGAFAVSDLRGGSFSISNLGAIGGQYSTPIVNVPEVAILLVGRSRKLPVVMPDDTIQPRLMMPLSLSYDHRLVDGATAARFLNDVIGYLEAPSRLLLAL